jgi:4Fe-4S ferredoxin
MPMRLVKTETGKTLRVERILHPKRYSLTLNKTVCTGCGLCKEVCPMKAIEIRRISRAEKEKKMTLTIDVDEQKCQYCGICNLICPFGALEVRLDGEHVISVIEKESFPRLVREIEVDTTQCDVGCFDCEEACPLNLIKISVWTPDGKEVTDIESGRDREDLSVKVDLKRDLCPCCRLCEMKCPAGAIKVQKIFFGNMQIDPEKCPEDCRDCLEVCPITGALYETEEGKIRVNELFCVYCGACKIVCPEKEALELQRTFIRHTPVHSGTWNRALEKLMSTTEMVKELRSKSIARRRATIARRGEGVDKKLFS